MPKRSVRWAWALVEVLSPACDTPVHPSRPPDTHTKGSLVFLVPRLISEEIDARDLHFLCVYFFSAGRLLHRNSAPAESIWSL